MQFKIPKFGFKSKKRGNAAGFFGAKLSFISNHLSIISNKLSQNNHLSIINDKLSKKRINYKLSIFGKKLIINYKLLIAVGVLALAATGGTLALNGFFGGGAAIPEDTMTRGLVGYWSFDEGGGTIARDASGNNNHGTLTNGPKWTQGKSGGALQFDGKDDYVSVASNTNLNMGANQDFTIETWIKYSNNPSYHIVAGKYCDIITAGYWLDVQGNNIRLRVSDAGGNYVDTITTAQYNDNKWHHVMAIADRDGLAYIYIDGNQVKSNDISSENGDTGTGAFSIGRPYDRNYAYFNGQIDELRIYNRALSEEEVRYHYNHGGPVAYWDMDEGSGTVLNDKSGNGNDGTISGATWTQGKYGSALSFDGTDDYAQATVSQTKTAYSLWVKNGANWEHVVNNNGTYYVNGAPGTPTSYPVYVSGSTVQVGKSGASTFVNCEIDEVKIYDYARTEEEIRLDYNAGVATHLGPSGKTCSEDPAGCMDFGLAGHWDMDEGSGSVINDKSGNNNHGTLANGPQWTKGKSGTALQFDGKDDYVDAGNGSSLNITDSITLEAWVFMDYTGSKNSDLGFIAKESSYLLYDTWGELRVMSAFWIDGAWRHSTSTGVNSNQWYHLVTTYSSLDRTIRFYIDGNEVAPVVLSGLSAYSLNISANNVHLGNGTLGKKNRVDEARIYNRVLTAEEVRYHYNHGGPVAYWDMDEGSGLKINDKSGNGNDGTISGATWTQGKHGSALSFDGSNDYAIVPHNDSLGIVADITIGAWIKKNNPDIRNDIVYKTTGGYSFMTHYTDRALYFQAQDSGGVWRAVSSNSNAIVDSDWHYVAVTYSRPDVVFYVDGKYWGTASRDYDMKSTSGSLYVGSMASTNYFNGQIDEVKIYDYARTEEEIRLDYNAGLATHLGPSGKTCSEDPAGCMDYGLAGHWDMDEGSGSMINDKSGNNNHGTLTNGPKWTKGKSGGALQFDGKDDYVSVADSDSLTFGNGVADSGFSIESWVRYDVIGAGHSLLIAQKNNEYALTNNNWLRLYLYDRSTGGILARDAIYLVNTYKKGEWIHLIVTYDGSALSSGIKFYLDGKLYNGGTPAGSSGTYVSMENTADNLEIAYPGTDAALDGVKIYNRALSAEEVRYHYNQGKPVGYWAFDEGEGTRAFDVSGNNNTGVLTNGPTWVEGKHGSALSFDGTDDSVSCPGGNLALTGDLTISAWIKLNSTSGYHWIVSKNYTKEYTFGTHNSELRFYHGDGSYYASDSLNAGLSSNNWYYVSVSRDTDQKKVKFYVNGKYISEWNYTNDITSSTQMVKIGTRSDDYSWFDGFIDEVKVYNYARTAEQIMQDYNAGVATHLK